MNTIDAMREKLAALAPLQLEIADDSGHYRLTIVSPRFSGCGTMQRHRLIYEALGPMMRGEIHALSIKALAPEDTD